MAGMGFELRKIFTKKSQTAQTLRVLHSSLTTLGAGLIFVVLVFAIGRLLNAMDAYGWQKEFFYASFMYISLMGILISSVVNSVLSRYVSDRIIEEKESQVCASMFGSMIISTLASALGMGVLCFVLWKCVRTDWTLLVLCYAFGIVWTLSHNVVVYASALKKCGAVIFSSIAGTLIFGGVMFLYYCINPANVLHGIYLALICGFFAFDLALACIIRKALGVPGTDYFAFCSYFKKHAFLWGSGLFFFWGLFISNVLYWYFSEMRFNLIGLFVAPSYDMSVFLILLCNMPGLFLFEYVFRKQLYAKYNRYVAAVEEGSFEVIERETEKLQKAVKLLLIFMYGMQFVISLIFAGLCGTWFETGGALSESQLQLFPLEIGVAFIFCMYYTITLFCYFSGYKESFVISVVFAVAVTGCSIYSCMIAGALYSLPLLAGGIIGWLVAFLLLQNRLKDLNAYMLCK